MNIEVAARLLDYRKKSGYSQEELAEKIGVSRQAISKWERSESSPDTDNLIALSKLYNVSIDELLNGKSEEAKREQDATPQPAQAEPEEAEDEDKHPARNGIIFFTGIIAFLLTGFLLKWWAFSWTFILLTICVVTLIEAIEKKKPDHFAYPLFAVSVFCLVGLVWGVWNSTWVIFLTIPVYYMLCEAIKKKNKH